MLAMKKVDHVYALSGTPIPNRPIELWPILHGLGIYRGGWFDFAARYARLFSAPWGMDASGASNLPELKALMLPHVLRRKKENIFKDYKEPQVSLITFDLPNDKREQSFDADALMANPNALLAFEGLAEIMREVGLDPATMARYPHEFSGGQRQRIAIARAMILRPKLVVLDEPTSALDMTVQVQIVELLRDLQRKWGLAYIFISHDLRVVRALSHKVMVMKDGDIVEAGTGEALFAAPQTDYTRALFAAAFGETV